MKYIILDDIIEFYNQIKDNGISEKLLSNSSGFMIRVDDYFETNRFKSIILVAIYIKNKKGIKPSLEDLLQFLNAGIPESFVCKRELKNLTEIGFFEYRLKVSFIKGSNGYNITKEIKEDILQNKPYQSPKYHPAILKPFNPSFICLEVYGLINMSASKASALESNKIHLQIEQLLEAYKETQFICYLNNMELTKKDKMVYLWLITDNIEGYSSSEVSSFGIGIYFDNDLADFLRALDVKSTNLTKKGYVSYKKKYPDLNSIISLTELSQKQLAAFNLSINLES